MAALVDRVKARYLPDEAMPDDPAIEEMIQTVTDRLLIRLKVERLPRLAESIAVDAAVKALRLRGYEGSTSESASDGGSMSNSFIDDVLSAYSSDIEALRDACRPKGIKFMGGAPMKWYRARAFRREQTGTDELHNPVCSTVEAFDFFVRFGPSHKVRSAEVGNAFDSVSRSLLTKRPATDFADVCGVVVKGASYEVENVMADGDTAVVSVKRCKPWDS